MKERPILFSAPMVRALLDGSKTQTRRVVKPQPEAEHGGEPYWFVGGYRAWRARSCTDPIRSGSHNEIACPYGQPGGQLWVRETWARDDEDGGLCYRADIGKGGDADDWERNRLDGVPRFRWRPSIHMPRAASRITLEITGVRVERLQDISPEDCWAEGIQEMRDAGDENGELRGSVKQDYQALWESINGPGSWDANPWVWVVEFKRVEGGAA
jgi:hypothetical protein